MDRLFFAGGTTAGFQSSFNAAVTAGRFSNSPPAESEHPGMSTWGGRQNVQRNALQVGGGTAGAFADIDFYNPGKGIRGFFGHTGEVLRNKATGGKTDPFKVGRGLGSSVTGYTCTK